MGADMPQVTSSDCMDPCKLLFLQRKSASCQLVISFQNDFTLYIVLIIRAALTESHPLAVDSFEYLLRNLLHKYECFLKQIEYLSVTRYKWDVNWYMVLFTSLWALKEI